MKVWGFEGQVSESVPLVRTTPALEVDGVILNPRTGARISLERAEELALEGHLTKLLKSQELDPAPVDPSVLEFVAIDPATPALRYIRPEAGKTVGVLASSGSKQASWWLFESSSAFRRYATDRLTVILRELLKTKPDETLRAPLFSAGRVLDRSHPFLAALRVHYSTDELRYRQSIVARAEVASSPTGLADFEACMMALDAGAVEANHGVTLRYIDGVAAGGGLDLSDAAKILGNIGRLWEPIHSWLKEQFPWLAAFVSEPRLMELKPSSAALKFSAHPKEASPGEYLARHFALRELDRLLHDPSEWAADNPQVIQTLREVVEPTPETNATLVRLGGGDAVPLTPPEVVAPRSAQTVSVAALGYQSGLVNDAGNIEFMVAPGAPVLVPADENGEGLLPAGLDFLGTNSDVLYQCAWVRLQCRIPMSGPVRWYVNQFQHLGNGRFHVDGFPSTVLPGALFVLPTYIPVMVEGEAVRIGDETVQYKSRGPQPARDWLLELQRVTQPIEERAARAGTAKWIPVSRRVGRLIALARIAEVLAQSPTGAMPVSEVVDVIQERYKLQVRVNNTRREVLRQQAYVTFADQARKILQVTEIGRIFVMAMNTLFRLRAG